MSGVTADTVATIIGATSLVAGTLSVMAKFFIRSVVGEELRKMREYLDDKLSGHLRSDHGYTYRSGRGRVDKPRANYKAEEEP